MPTPPRKPRRWKILIALLVVIALGVFHRVWLPWMAMWLTRSANPERLDYVVLLDLNRLDPEIYDFVAKRLDQQPDLEIVLMQHDSRSVRFGGDMSFQEICSAELFERGVESPSLTVVPFESHAWGHIMATLERWLADNPGDALLVCSRFDAQLCWSRLNQKPRDGLTEVLGLPVLAIDETNWWKSAMGIKRVLFAYIDQFHSLWKGRIDQPGQRWKPAEYEEWLNNRQQDAPKAAEPGHPVGAAA